MVKDDLKGVDNAFLPTGGKRSGFFFSFNACIRFLTRSLLCLMISSSGSDERRSVEGPGSSWDPVLLVEPDRPGSLRVPEWRVSSNDSSNDPPYESMAPEEDGL